MGCNLPPVLVPVDEPVKSVAGTSVSLRLEYIVTQDTEARKGSRNALPTVPMPHRGFPNALAL